MNYIPPNSKTSRSSSKRGRKLGKKYRRKPVIAIDKRYDDMKENPNESYGLPESNTRSSGFTVKEERSSLVETNPTMAGFGRRPAFAPNYPGRRIIPAEPPGQNKYVTPVDTSNNALKHVSDVAKGLGGTAAAVGQVIDTGIRINELSGGRIGNEIKKRITKKGDKGNKGNNDSNGGGGGSTTYTNNNSLTGGGYSYNMMCDKPQSQKIDLVTGVRSGLIVNPGEPVNDEDYSDLYLMGGHLLKKDAVATSFKEYIETVVFPYVQTSVQFSLNYSYELTLTQFNDWFYALTKALELYYTLDSIIAFNDNKLNTNRGTRKMRTKITSGMRLRLNLLRDILGKQPIPPRVLHLVRYMYQHFKFSSLPGAPVYRLVPGNLYNELASYGDCDSYINRLSEETVKNVTTELISHSAVYNKIYQALPEWHVPNNCMPPSCNEAYYDSSFRTFWFNATTTYVAGTTLKYCRQDDDPGNFRYWLYTNNYDGVFFAMSSFNKTGEEGTRPGIWVPTIDYSAVSDAWGKSNCLVYTPQDTIQPITHITGKENRLPLQFDNYCVPYWSQEDALMKPSHNLDGSMQVAQECTFDTWKQAVYRTSQWLFE